MHPIRALRGNVLIRTLVGLRGNPRVCLFTEPLWGIPYNLYMPYVSLYMAALGLSDVEIGLVATVSLCSQVVFSLLGGALTDKLGRRLCTLVFDTLSWSVPTLLWGLTPFIAAAGVPAVACFITAALFNGAWHVTSNSWGCLLVEDAPEESVVHYFTIAQICGLLAAFFAPLAAIFVARYSLVPTVQVLYFITCLMMTLKFVILYVISKETRVGARRREALRGKSLLSIVAGYRGVLKMMLKTPLTLYTIGLFACFSLAKTLSETFWGLFVTSQIGLAEGNLSYLSTLKSVCMLICYFFLAPHLSAERFKRPMVTAFGLVALSQVLLLVTPRGAWWALLVVVPLEAVGYSILSPLTESLQFLNVDREERARVLGLFQSSVLLFTMPFGYLGGLLSSLNRALPFVLNLLLFALAVFFAVRVARCKALEASPEPAPTAAGHL